LCLGPSRRRPIVRFRGAADYWASYIFTAGPVEAATGTAARLETIEVGPPDLAGAARNGLITVADAMAAFTDRENKNTRPPTFSRRDRRLVAIFPQASQWRFLGR